MFNNQHNSQNNLYCLHVKTLTMCWVVIMEVLYIGRVDNPNIHVKFIECERNHGPLNIVNPYF